MTYYRAWKPLLRHLSLTLILAWLLYYPLAWFMGGIINIAHPSARPPQTGFSTFHFHWFILINPAFLFFIFTPLVQEFAISRTQVQGLNIFNNGWRTLRNIVFVAIGGLLPWLCWTLGCVIFLPLCIPWIAVAYVTRLIMTNIKNRFIRLIPWLGGIGLLIAMAYMGSTVMGDNDGDMQNIVGMGAIPALLALVCGGLADFIMRGRSAVKESRNTINPQSLVTD